MSNYKYLDLNGLVQYTEHIKNYIDNGDSEFIICTVDESNPDIYVGNLANDMDDIKGKKCILFITQTSQSTGAKSLSLTSPNGTRYYVNIQMGKLRVTKPFDGGTIIRGIFYEGVKIDNTMHTRGSFYIEGDIHTPYTEDEIKTIKW